MYLGLLHESLKVGIVRQCRQKKPLLRRRRAYNANLLGYRARAIERCHTVCGSWFQFRVLRSCNGARRMIEEYQR
jgi:hypothetical protein